MTAIKQKLYNKAKLHLLTQNAQSKYNSQCRYRGMYGRKCGAGIFIPDEKYSEEMEGLTWESVNTTFQLNVPHPELIDDVQILHDTRSPREWAQALQTLAHKHGLIP